MSSEDTWIDDVVETGVVMPLRELHWSVGDGCRVSWPDGSEVTGVIRHVAYFLSVVTVELGTRHNGVLKVSAALDLPYQPTFFVGELMGVPGGSV